VFKSGWSLLKLYVHVEIEMYPQALSIYFHTLTAEGELLCTILIESRIPRKLLVTRLQAGQLLFDFQQGRVFLSLPQYPAWLGGHTLSCPLGTRFFLEGKAVRE
jgi:hypothetical protein